jgi:hypothetical protein
LDFKCMQLKKDTLRLLLGETPSLEFLRLLVDASEVTDKFIMGLRLSKLSEVVLDTTQRIQR